MKISLIVAVATNGAIGKNNQLLWHLPADMQYFKKTTLGHTVVMGRKNFESIPEKFRPLPNRTNIILTRKKDFFAKGCFIAHSLEEAILFAKQRNETECFIIGGGEVYNEAMEKKICSKLYITYVETKIINADTFFNFEPDSTWRKVKEEHIESDQKNPFPMRFCIFEKIE